MECGTGCASDRSALAEPLKLQGRGTTGLHIERKRIACCERLSCRRGENARRNAVELSNAHEGHTALRCSGWVRYSYRVKPIVPARGRVDLQAGTARARNSDKVAVPDVGHRGSSLHPDRQENRVP